MKKRRESARQSSMSRSSMAVEADWSELPKDILNLISKQMDNEIDLIRFRSICSNWRSSSSSIPNHHTNILPFKFPLLQYVFASDEINENEYSDSINMNDTNFPFSYLSKRSLFLIKPPPQQDQTLIHRPWLVRITQNSSGKTKLFKPRIQSPLPSIHYSSNLLDFNELSVHHLGTDFIIDDDDRLPNQDRHYMNPKTVLAVTCHVEKPLVLSTLCYFTPRPVLFRGRDERWVPFFNMPTVGGDICVFKGRFYTVDMHGKTVSVGADSNVQLVAEALVHTPSTHLGRKLLVESEGELWLVDVIKSFPSCSIDLFQLDVKEKKWVKLKDIGDKVLFLGTGCSFSASASELGLPKGNCVVFFDNSVLCCANLGHRDCVSCKLAGCGGIIRDANGKWIWDFAMNIDLTAVLQVLKKGGIGSAMGYSLVMNICGRDSWI